MRCVTAALPAKQSSEVFFREEVNSPSVVFADSGERRC